MTTQLSKGSELRLLQNAYPSIDLVRTMRRLSGLKERAGDKTKFNRKELISNLNFGVVSGAANAVISALMYFGFLQRLETDYFYTELGNRFLASTPGSEEYSKALKEAVSTPELYKWLNEKYQQLPDEIEDILVGKYHDRGVRKENVKSIINNYMKSVAFVTNSASAPAQSDELELDEYVSVSFRGNTVPIYTKYLVEALKKTREDELAKINESLRLNNDAVK